MNDKQQRFAAQHPGTFFLTLEQPQELLAYLKKQGWVGAEEAIEGLEKPGEGNMNYVVRVKSSQKSLIVKQSRPWVEKYPQLDAPIERIQVEARFYEMLAADPILASYIPALLAFSNEDFILVVEDLGEASDFTEIYKKTETIAAAELAALMQFLTRLHLLDPHSFAVPFPENKALRNLNAEHIFTYPFLEDNGFNLDVIQPGLQALAVPYKQNAPLKGAIDRLGALYLSPGNVLIHGDFYPGSWLRTDDGARIIDPEFSFVGYAEFDLGVLIAHLTMAQVAEQTIQESLSAYRPGTGFDNQLLAGFCGAEVLRRLIGLAQLPLDLDLEEKDRLLQWAARAVLHPADFPYSV